MSKTSQDDEAGQKTGKKVRKKKVSTKKATHMRSPSVRKNRLGTIILACLATVLLVIGIGKLMQSNLEKDEKRKVAKKKMLLISALDKLHIACTVFWSGIGRGESCSQDIWEKIADRHYEKVKVTVLKGEQYEFTAQARHTEINQVFEVDRKGDVFLKNNGCLAKVTFKALTPENLQSLEKQCQ